MAKYKNYDYSQSLLIPVFVLSEQIAHGHHNNKSYDDPHGCNGQG
jgi:hypothetical protein